MFENDEFARELMSGPCSMCGYTLDQVDSDGEREKLRAENAQILKEGEAERAVLVHIMLDVEDWKEGRKLAAETIRGIEHRVKTVMNMRATQSESVAPKDDAR